VAEARSRSIAASTQRESERRDRRNDRPFSPVTVRFSMPPSGRRSTASRTSSASPEHDPSRSRWAWSYPIRSVTVVTDLNRAPPVEAAGIFPQSLWRHSHIRLTEEQFESARKLIEAAAK